MGSKYLLGYDIGSSSIKATIIQADTGKVVTSATSPQKELEIIARQPGWAEQNPQTWWQHVVKATMKLKGSGVDIKQVAAIGISYQMHGLVLVDKNQEVLRPSIIWCDSRAVDYGEEAFKKIGEEKCLWNFLNSPGNFTASKLKWVKKNEPEVFRKIDKIMLPGDYIAMKLSGDICTTPSGLSEGILWNFPENKIADLILDHFGFSQELIPEIKPTFSIQAQVSNKAARELGLKPGTKISYRAGDQPNNALSLNVLHPGEIAATAGTSGVVYGVIDRPAYDKKSRVNPFVHVNHSEQRHRYGILMCINGTGILNSWLRHNFMTLKNAALSYEEMNELASKAPIGAEGLVILPYGNGAERTLQNKNIGSLIKGLAFNNHNTSHVLRAAQEGIVFALNYGIKIMQNMGMKVETVRAGHTNMFLSPLFAETFASVTGAIVELYNTDGSQGAARGAGIGAGIYKNSDEAFSGLTTIRTITPDVSKREQYLSAYSKWEETLQKEL